MRKLLPVVVLLALAGVSCESKAPLEPARVTSIVQAPNAAPVVKIESPTASDTFTVGESVAFVAKATDAIQGDLTAGITWSRIVGDQETVVGRGGTLTATFPLGTHLMRASATDRSGLVGFAAVSVKVVAPKPKAGPVVTIVAPAPGATFAPGTPVTFLATAVDPEDGNVAATLKWTSSLDGPLGAGAALVVTPPSTGSHIITATALDSEGTVGSGVTVVTIGTPSGGGGGDGGGTVVPPSEPAAPAGAEFRFVPVAGDVTHEAYPNDLSLILKLISSPSDGGARTSAAAATYDVSGTWTASWTSDDPSSRVGIISGRLIGLPGDGSVTLTLVGPCSTSTDSNKWSFSFQGTISDGTLKIVRGTRSAGNENGCAFFPVEFSGFTGYSRQPGFPAPVFFDPDDF